MDLSSLDENQKEAFHELKNQMEGLEDVDDYLGDDGTYIRYLKARKWNVSAAAKMLRGSLEWRKSYEPMLMTCQYCLKEPGYHSWRQVGFDRTGRSVTYSCIAQGKTQNLCPDDCVQHATMLLENCLPLAKERGASSYVWILDMTGLTMGACNPRLAAATNKTMSKYYPERLGLALIVSAPWIFNATWTAMKTFLDPETQKKVHFIKPDDLDKKLHDYFPDELAEWLLEEMSLNKSIDPQQLCFWRPPESPDQHDSRGCPSYVKQYIEPVLEKRRQVASKETLSESGMKLLNGHPLHDDNDDNDMEAPVRDDIVRKVTIELAGDESSQGGVPSFPTRQGLPHPNIVFPPPTELAEKVVKARSKRHSGDEIEVQVQRMYRRGSIGGDEEVEDIFQDCFSIAPNELYSRETSHASYASSNDASPSEDRSFSSESEIVRLTLMVDQSEPKLTSV